jgi:OPA family glycerol-3-phosphate transporter-like MFS transporter 1/2
MRILRRREVTTSRGSTVHEMATLVTPRPQPRACGRTHAAHQAQVWLVTFGSYMAFHWSRKIYSVVKSQMGPGLALSTTEIGALDTIFLASYALCMPVSGYFVDRREHRTLLGWAMIGAGAGCAACGLLDARVSVLSAPPGRGVSFVVLAALYIFTGCCQSAGWPANVAIIGGWYGKATRGCVLGVWNAHTSVGNIAGTLSATLAITSVSWGAAFFLDGIVMLLMGVVVLKLLLDPPVSTALSGAAEDGEECASLVGAAAAGVSAGDDQRLELEPISPSEADDGTDVGDDDTSAATDSTSAGGGISVAQALAIPGVVEFSLCFFFAKFVSYTFLFWLPFYLQALGFSAGMAGTLSTVFDIGGIVGGIFAGWLSDKLQRRAVVASGFMALSVPALVAYRAVVVSADTPLPTNAVLMFVVGVLVNGTYALITTAVSADLGSHESLRGDVRLPCHCLTA